MSAVASLGLADALANRRVRGVAFQAAGAVALCAVTVLLVRTLADNLARLNLGIGFDFLLRPAGMPMGESMIAFAPTDSFLRAMLAAGLNTVRVSVAGIVLATVVGTLVGIGRLSGNPLLRRIATAYVELFRNTPVLLQILFWSALLLKLPSVRQAVSVGGVAFLSQRGMQLPWFSVRGDFSSVWSGMAAAVVGGVIVGWLARRIASRGLATLVGVVAAAGLFAAGLAWSGLLAPDVPVKKLFGYTGGLTLSPEFCALLAGLVAYTGAFIAEIVRGGILAVPRGQWEAARSLGLRDGAILRKVVLPQALRVMLPAMASQYVGVVKNSSLAIAIGFPDLFWATSTAINVTGHAIEGVLAMMAGYLVLTLGTAGVMNAWYRRLLRAGAR